VALDNRVGLRQAGLSRKEPDSVPHLPRVRRSKRPFPLWVNSGPTKLSKKELKAEGAQRQAKS
jgi:hypothetical protein